MTDYAPDFTARFRVRYHGAGRDHSQTWRFDGPGTSPTDIDAVALAISDIYNQIGPVMFDDWTFLSSSYAPRGSSIFLPGPAVSVSPGATTFDPTDRATTAQSLSFVGRSTGGLRAIIYQYGSTLKPGEGGGSTSNDFRVFSGEHPDIANTVGQLNISSTLVGNDGNPVVWYPYANVKFNDYWGRKVRQGA